LQRSQVHVVHVNLLTNQPDFVNGRCHRDTSLFCCPSIISQALRAEIVAAEVPLRGKLHAEATTFFIDQRILEVIYQRFQTLLLLGLILCWHARIAPCSTRGQNRTCRPRVLLGAWQRPRIRRRALRAPPLHPRTSCFFRHFAP